MAHVKDGARSRTVGMPLWVGLWPTLGPDTTSQSQDTEGISESVYIAPHSSRNVHHPAVLTPSQSPYDVLLPANDDLKNLEVPCRYSVRRSPF